MRLEYLFQKEQSSFRFYATGVGILGVIWTCTNYFSRSNERKRLPYPPGPVRLPFIGNFLDTPRSHAWLQAAEWGKKYGDIVFLESLGLKTLYLNSYSAANELLENRSANYSSRPPLVLLRDVAGWDWSPVFFPYGEALRKFRAAMARYFQPSVLQTFYPMQSRLVADLLHSILRSPENYERHIRRLPAAQIMMITYGHKVMSDDDEFVCLADSAARYISSSMEDSYIDIFPILKYLPGWLPGMARIRKAREGYKVGQDSCYVPYNVTKENILQGTAIPSLTSNLLQGLGEGNVDLDEPLIAGTTGTLYIAASDTVTSAIVTCILAMLLYPEVMQSAQEELDRVVGKDCLPTFADRVSLPYINAICLECLRWEMVVPLGVPHVSERDDIYNGYLIPAGTIIYPNQWAMGMDARMYENPEEFDPERWLQAEPPLLSNKYAFGFGRRICPGKDFAEATIYIAIASLLACFNFEKGTDENGKTLEPDRNRASIPGAVRRAMGAVCKITPRSEGIERLIRVTAASFE